MPKQVVLIDDDDQFIFLAALKAVMPDSECFIKNNGLEAFRDLQALHDNPDMIFLDLNMPMMNGFEFISLLQTDARLSEIPIIIYSTSNNPSDIKRAKELGAIQFISKTAEFQSLKRELGLIYSMQHV